MGSAVILSPSRSVSALQAFETKAQLGQYFTSARIAAFMASLFERIEGDIRLLDPGCGAGALFAAFTEEMLQRNAANSLHLSCYEIDQDLHPHLHQTNLT